MTDFDEIIDIQNIMEGPALVKIEATDGVLHIAGLPVGGNYGNPLLARYLAAARGLLDNASQARIKLSANEEKGQDEDVRAGTSPPSSWLRMVDCRPAL